MPGLLRAGQAYQRAFHIVKQTYPANVGCNVAGYEDIIPTRAAMNRQKTPCSFPQAPAGTVAHDCAANLLCCRVTLANMR